MKKSIRKVLLIITSVIITATAHAAPAASIVLSNTPVSNNLTHYTVTDPGNEPYTIQTSIGGMECRQIPNTKYGYFNVGDGAVSSTQNNLIFTITYYDNGTDGIQFQYNGISPNNYQTININKTGTNAWITATIAVTDASLRNAQNNACDFRIGGSTNSNYINAITITIGALNPAGEPVPTTVGSTYSEFKGKTVAGYQVWFSTGNTNSGWFHWAGGSQPAVGHLNFEVYPDATEYSAADLTQTGFANLGNGTPSKLFNSANTGVIGKHFDWMKTAGIDGVALQRFINGLGVINNSPAASPIKVKTAAEATNRIFYICYDISSNGLDATWDEIIKQDWVYNIEQAYGLTTSPAYAKVGNKPVVELWGTGFTGNHPGTEQETIDLIHFLQARGCYVIGGVPTYWRTETGDSKADFIDAYKEYDMISPWSVGRFGDTNGATNFKNNLIVPDKTFCDQNNIDYLPVVFPGFSWSQWNNNTANAPNAIPRKAGDFWWQQTSNIKSAGINAMYLAMFDEYDEGTAIMKAATDYTMIPTDQYFVTTSADGIWTSSDFYLRLAGAGTELLKGTRTASATVPIPYSLGPIYYRNSFEKRYTVYNATGAQNSGNGYFNIDPCFYNDVSVSSTGVSGQSVAIENNQAFAKTGLFTTKITGTTSSATASSHYYKISDTKIIVKENMQVSFWKYSVNTLGQYTNVDLVFQSGKRLSALPAYVDNAGAVMSPAIARGTVGSWQKYSCQIGTGVLIGDVITGIIIGYDHPSATGSYNAYFDDIIVEDALPPVPVVTSGATASATANAAFTYTITASNSPTSYAATNLPTGLTLNTTTGVISGQTAAGTYTITLTASNAGGPSAGKTLTLTVTAVPVITSSATASATANAAFTYTITATNSPTSYAATNLPTGLTLNATTGVISGQAAAGTYTITLTATNAGGPSTGKTLTLTVTAVPVITSSATASATANAAFTYTITASNSPTSYAATNLPTGLTLNATTGVISGQAAAGTYTITLTASNAGGPSAGKTLMLTVTNAVSVPVITSAGSASATVGLVFSYSIVASGNPSSYAATGLPAGLTINTTTGVISGTPTQSGTFTVTLKASNTGGDGTTSLTLNIAPQVTTGLTNPTVQKMSVYPNPVQTSGVLTLQFTDLTVGEYEVQIYNYLGQSIYTKTLSVTEGTSVYSIDLPQQMSIGYYVLDIISPSGQRSIQNIEIQ